MPRKKKGKERWKKEETRKKINKMDRKRERSLLFSVVVRRFALDPPLLLLLSSLYLSAPPWWMVPGEKKVILLTTKLSLRLGLSRPPWLFSPRVRDGVVRWGSGWIAYRCEGAVVANLKFKWELKKEWCRFINSLTASSLTRYNVLGFNRRSTIG